MRIATEIGWGHKTGGARRVAFRVLQEIAALRPSYQLPVYCNTFQQGLAGTTAIEQQVLSCPASIPQTVWDQFIFPHWAVPRSNRLQKPDLIHHTNNMVSFFGHTPVVVTIHDMTPFLIPETFRCLHGFYQRAYFRYAAQKAARIITVSESSKRDICRILGVVEERVTVAPLAVDQEALTPPGQEARQAYFAEQGIDQPFILYVGAIHPRKNLGRIIGAFANLKKEKGIPHKLVIVGAKRWMADKLFAGVDCQAIVDQLIFPGVVDDRDLASLYAGCDAFVWPSLYEGFGLPILEAMHCGAPVITSNCSSMPGVAADAALLVDPTKQQEIQEALWKVLDDRSFAQELAKKGRKRAAEFSWRKTAEIVLKVYEEILL